MFVFDVMLGRVVHFGSLPNTSDSIVLVPFETSTAIDDDLKSITNLEDLALALTESSAGRVTASAASAGVGLASLTNSGWISPAAAPEITRIVVCYKPVSTSLDADIVPMVSLDVEFTPDSTTDFQINLEDGYFQATGYNYV